MQAAVLAPRRRDELNADRRLAAKTGTVATGRPMQENGCASRPRFGRRGTVAAGEVSRVFAPIGGAEQGVAGASSRSKSRRPRAPARATSAAPAAPAPPRRPAAARRRGSGRGSRDRSPPPAPQPLEMEVGALGIGDEVGRRAARLGLVEVQRADLGVRRQRLGDAGDRGARLRRRRCRGTSRRARRRAAAARRRRAPGHRLGRPLRRSRGRPGHGPCSAS